MKLQWHYLLVRVCFFSGTNRIFYQDTFSTCRVAAETKHRQYKSSSSTASSSPTQTASSYRLLPKKPRLPAPSLCAATLSKGVNTLWSLIKMRVNSILSYASKLSQIYNAVFPDLQDLKTVFKIKLHGISLRKKYCDIWITHFITYFLLTSKFYSILHAGRAEGYFNLGKALRAFISLGST